MPETAQGIKLGQGLESIHTASRDSRTPAGTATTDRSNATKPSGRCSARTQSEPKLASTRAGSVSSCCRIASCSIWSIRGTGSSPSGAVRPKKTVRSAPSFEIMRVYTEDIEAGTSRRSSRSSRPNSLSLFPQASLIGCTSTLRTSMPPPSRRSICRLKAIKHGGFLIGDDYDPNPSSFQHGVFLAVNEVVSSLGVSLSLCDGRQWAFQVQ